MSFFACTSRTFSHLLYIRIDDRWFYRVTLRSVTLHSTFVTPEISAVTTSYNRIATKHRYALLSLRNTTDITPCIPFPYPFSQQLYHVQICSCDLEIRPITRSNMLSGLPYQKNKKSLKSPNTSSQWHPIYSQVSIDNCPAFVLYCFQRRTGAACLQRFRPQVSPIFFIVSPQKIKRQKVQKKKSTTIRCSFFVATKACTALHRQNSAERTIPSPARQTADRPLPQNILSHSVSTGPLWNRTP